MDEEETVIITILLRALIVPGGRRIGITNQSGVKAGCCLGVEIQGTMP
jgi:hypothetical protein